MFDDKKRYDDEDIYEEDFIDNDDDYEIDAPDYLEDDDEDETPFGMMKIPLTRI